MRSEEAAAIQQFGIAAAIIAGVARNRVLNLLSASELADRVGLIRANKKGHTNEGSTIWPGLGAWRGKA